MGIAAMTTHGFLLGKFLPPHAGHIFMCEAAARLVDNLTVLVCSIDAEPIPGFLRHRWMVELLPTCRVIHMHREIPQEPSEHPNFWDIWKATIRDFHPEPIDYVFGSEGYVFRLAEELSANPVLLDPQRQIMPYSGRSIRESPGKHWDGVPKPVRSWFQRRVCLLGPESVGKSTLSQDLAAKFGGSWMPEYGRDYDLHYRQQQGWTAADFVMLANTHIAMREAAIASFRPLVFEDTDYIQTLVWAERLLGEQPSQLRAIESSESAADFYLLLEPDVPWVNDGTRYSGDEDVRTWFFERILSEITKRNLEFEIVSGADWNDRVNQAVSFVNRRFSGFQ